jgi:hypothetical protein
MQTRSVTEIVTELQAALNHSSSDAIEQRIKAKIKELKKDFDEELENYSVAGCQLDEYDLEEYEDFVKVDIGDYLFKTAIENDRYLMSDFGSIEDVVREINDVERHFISTRREIKELEELLKGDN